MENKIVAYQKNIQKNKRECEELLENKKRLKILIKNALTQIIKELGAEWLEVDVYNDGKLEIIFYETSRHYGFKYDKEIFSIKFNDDINLEIVNEIVKSIKGGVLNGD